MTGDSSLDTRRREAASWFSRLNQRRVSSDDVRGFFDWRRDPDNARAYEAIEKMWSAAEGLAANPEIASATRQAMAPRAAPERARAHLSRAFRPLAAMIVAALLVGGGVVWMMNRPAVYSTQVGERRTVVLADGSRVTLDTASRISVHLDRDRRLITLAQGQALFDVEHDRQRPFVVTAGDATVTALGTRFDVRLSGQGARVTLVEGRVAVETDGARPKRWTLVPDQRIVTTERDAAPARTDAENAVSWASGRLIFDRTPIRVAVAEVNRYTTRPITLDADAIADVPVSGAFDTGDVEGFIAALQDLYGVVPRRSEEGGVILQAPSVMKKSPNPV